MIGMVLVTHGRLASEFRAALEHVVGPQQQIETVAIGPEDDMEKRRKDIIEAVHNVDSGQGVVVGAKLADHLSLRAGDKVTIIAPHGAETPFGVTPRMKTYPVAAIFQIGMTTITYTVSDLAGNIAQCVFNITVQDRQPPELMCPDPAPFYTYSPLSTSAFVTWLLPVMTDNDYVSAFSNTMDPGTFQSPNLFVTSHIH